MYDSREGKHVQGIDALDTSCPPLHMVYVHMQRLCASLGHRPCLEPWSEAKGCQLCCDRAGLTNIDTP